MNVEALKQSLLKQEQQENERRKAAEASKARAPQLDGDRAIATPEQLREMAKVK